LHHLFGAIPLLVEAQTDARGRVYMSRRFDPGYEPPLPAGAVRGDIRRQSYCCDVPKYFYCDEDRTCVQCGREFVFRASEQKYWYETLQFNFSAVPVRCLGCRRKRRSEHALREQIGRAKAHIREAGANPAPHLALARALVEYHERTSQGDLDAAVAAARKAGRLWPESAEPLYWEGMAQAHAGRPAKARQALSAFLEHPALRRGSLKKNAQALAAILAMKNVSIVRTAWGHDRGDRWIDLDAWREHIAASPDLRATETIPVTVNRQRHIESRPHCAYWTGHPSGDEYIFLWRIGRFEVGIVDEDGEPEFALPRFDDALQRRCRQVAALLDAEVQE
jgi:Probable zinc-ribbon domain